MPYCTHCGTQVAEQAHACPQCGHPRAPAGVPSAGRRTEGSAVASLVLGIAGFAVCPIVLHIAAIILGNQARRRIDGDPMLEGDGLARAGVILGWVGLALYGLLLVVGLLGFLLSAPFAMLPPAAP